MQSSSGTNSMIGNKNAFTLIEIIAVLLILGILAAIALPKYMDLAEQAKVAAAQGEVAEMKSTLNLAYAKMFMSNGVQPTDSDSVISTAGFTSGVASNIGVAPDVWNITLTTAGAGAVTIAITSRNSDVGYITTARWNLPQ